MAHYAPESGVDPLGLTSAISGAVTGVSNTVLNYLDAFCVTEKCNQAAANRDTQKALAEASVEAAKWNAIGTANQAKAAAQTQQTLLIAAVGAAGIGALYLLTRGK